MKTNRILILSLLALLLLASQASADPNRVVDRLKVFGYWAGGIGIENGIGPDGRPSAMKYAFVSTDLNSAMTGPMHLEILLPPAGGAALSMLCPNMSGTYNAQIGAIDATLIVGGHTARLLGQAFSQVTHIYYMMPNFPMDFFKWAKGQRGFEIRFPLGGIPVSTDGLSQAANYAFKLRKELQGGR